MNDDSLTVAIEDLTKLVISEDAASTTLLSKGIYR